MPAGELWGRAGGRLRSGGGLVLAGVCVGVTAVGVAAATGALPGGDPLTGPRFAGTPNDAAGRPAPSGSPEPGANRVAGAKSAAGIDGDSQLRVELTRALGEIGRARAQAFEKASARYLLGADLAGSDAYQQDLELVQRLRSRGYRLSGVSYRISLVEVVRRRGAMVDVRAMVTTSGHRQVRLTPPVSPTTTGRDGDSGPGERGGPAETEVPADGPRAVIFTVAPMELNLTGPDRWRVSDVRVDS